MLCNACGNRSVTVAGKKQIIITTTSSGGMHKAFKAIVLATPEGVQKSPPIATQLRAAAKAAAYFYALGDSLPVNGSIYSLKLN